MEIKIKRLTHLGFGAVLATGVLAGCGGEEHGEAAGEQGESAIESAYAGESGEGESGSGGEGEGGEGEGGVSINAAMTDPVVYNSALAITEAHVVAARDAYRAGKAEAAAEMFAHPVSEVLFDMEPVFTALGVDDFSDLLTETSAAVFAGETTNQIDARTMTIIEALQAASEHAPDNGMSDARIAAGVASDQIERASDMYRAAAEIGRFEPYLDGYGYYHAGKNAFDKQAAAIEADNPDAANAIRTALALLADAYPGPTQPDSLDANQAALAAAASNVVLMVGN